jgi:hypothetical protein
MYLSVCKLVDVGIIDCVSEKVSECVEDVCPNFPNPEPEACRDLTAVNRDSPCRDQYPNSCRERYRYKSNASNVLSTTRHAKKRSREIRAQEIANLELLAESVEFKHANVSSLAMTQLMQIAMRDVRNHRYSKRRHVFHEF